MMTEIRQCVDLLDGFMRPAEERSAGEASKDLVRLAHTLAGTLALSPLGQEVEVARGLENYLEALVRKDGCAGAEAGPVIDVCLHRFRQRLAILEHGNATSFPLEDEQLLADLSALTAEVESTSSIDIDAATGSAPALSALAVNNIYSNFIFL